ncbi:hypothetical protein [Streptococcus uberis]|uniref:hypothetical protein n=1 Tax=Streptococcus uberis TaxID=1349 RepID=UPI0020BDE9E2|nr:hypothetical protein [Streptococcus uberis]
MIEYSYNKSIGLIVEIKRYERFGGVYDIPVPINDNDFKLIADDLIRKKMQEVVDELQPILDKKKNELLPIIEQKQKQVRDSFDVDEATRQVFEGRVLNDSL